MKKNYFLLLLTILFSGITFAQEAQKNFINYQGVARNAENQLIVSEAVTVGIALKSGSANGPAMYEEIHSITTDANGVFSLQIGNGSSSSGDYNSLSWGSVATFITVSMNGSKIGTTEMMSVPYAISSGKAVNQSAAEVLYDNAASGLSATTAQDAIDELMTGGSVDADADPSNEFQSLSFDAGTNELSLSDGNSVTIPSGGTDADADPTNEIQTISFDAASNKISLTDGGEITIPSGGTDADADPTNEIQTISFDVGTNELSLSDGGVVTIPSGGTDADADPTNEIQTISFDSGTNELSLSDGGVVTIPSGGTDADADPSNEFQTLNFDVATNELSLSDGNTVTIPSGGTDADADPTNEIQTISFDAGTNELSLSDGGVVTIPSGGTDADADPTNEIQDISLDGTELTISDGSSIDLASIVPPGGTDNQELTFNETTKILEIEDGNTVDLSSLSGGGGSSLWSEDSEGVSRPSGLVAIGDHASLTAKLFVLNTNQDIRNGIQSTINHSGYKAAISANARGNDDSNTFGVRSGARNESTGAAWAYRGDVGGAGTGTKYGLDLIFYEGTAGTKYGIKLKGEDKNYFSGDIGIGTEYPSAKLDVDGDARIRNLAGTGQRNVMADADGNLIIGAGGGSSLWNENGNRISYDSGNVGLGETNPTAKLHIKKGYSGSPFLEMKSTSGDRSDIRFSKSGSTSFWEQISGVRTDAATGSMSYYYHDAGTPNHIMTLRGDGKMGIGGFSPTSRLHIFQRGQDLGQGLRFSDGINDDWDIVHGYGLTFYYGGSAKGVINANTGAYTQLSDQRMKENIMNLKPILDKVIRLRPATYNYKSDSSKKNTLGLIAQEVQSLFPELVSSTGKDGMLGVDYGGFSVVAIRAIQEQQQIIDEQSEQISDLENRLKKIEEMLQEK